MTVGWTFLGGRNGVGETVRTLVVDDEADMQLLLSVTIDAANDGLVVAGVVSSGGEALEWCRRDRPDVVVLDQRMPDMTGVEVARRLAVEHPGVPIVLFSAYVDEATSAAALDAGVAVILPKTDLHGLIAALHATAA